MARRPLHLSILPVPRQFRQPIPNRRVGILLSRISERVTAVPGDDELGPTPGSLGGGNEL